MATPEWPQTLVVLMEKHQLSIADLARRSGVHYVLISGYLKAATEPSYAKRGKLPSFKTLLKLADAIPCSLDELVGRPWIDATPQQLEQYEPSELAERVAKLYDDLPEDHWLHKAIDEVLLKNRTKGSPKSSEETEPPQSA